MKTCSSCTSKVLSLLIILEAGVISYKVGAECIGQGGPSNFYSANATSLRLLRAKCFLGCISPGTKPFNVSRALIMNIMSLQSGLFLQLLFMILYLLIGDSD